MRWDYDVDSTESKNGSTRKICNAIPSGVDESDIDLYGESSCATSLRAVYRRPGELFGNSEDALVGIRERGTADLLSGCPQDEGGYSRQHIGELDHQLSACILSS